MKPHRTHPLRIIMVDDEEWRLVMFGTLISRNFKGVTVQSYQDAEKAWQELSRADPDLLITDDIMGVLNGDEIVGRLADKKVAYPIIVFNGYGPQRDQWVSDCAKRGLDVTMLRFPFPIESFLRALESGLRISRDAPAPVEFAAHPALALTPEQERFKFLHAVIIKRDLTDDEWDEIEVLRAKKVKLPKARRPQSQARPAAGAAGPLIISKAEPPAQPAQAPPSKQALSPEQAIETENKKLRAIIRDREMTAEEMEKFDELIAELRAEGPAIVPIPPECMIHYAKYGAATMAALSVKGALKFSRWSQEIMKGLAEIDPDLSERIKPHLKAIWDEAGRMLDQKMAELLGPEPADESVKKDLPSSDPNRDRQRTESSERDGQVGE